MDKDGRGLRQPALVNDAPAGHRPSGFDPARLARSLTLAQLYDFKNVAEGRPTPQGFDTPVWHLKCLGYVEECTVKKPCPACGEPQIDYRYNKITDAGREVLEAAIAIEARRAETLGSVHESAAIAQPPSQSEH